MAKRIKAGGYTQPTGVDKSRELMNDGSDGRPDRTPPYEPVFDKRTVGIEWTQERTIGAKIAEISINGQKQDVYAPQGGGGGIEDVRVDGVSVVDPLTGIANIDGKANDNSVVHITGDETVDGIKTFTSPPVVPTPTNNTDVANKGYVDGHHDPTKQDVIGDLGTIRSNAQTGATHASDTTVHVTSIEKGTWNGKYVKPSGGIPSTDMASAVQVSLGKADTALQSVPDTYRTAAAQDVIDATKASVTDLTNHTGDTVVHVTSGDKTNWNGKSVVGWNEVVLTGTKIATITINGVATDVYAPEGGGTPTWGAIVGTLSDQTDLKDALDAKANDSDVVHKTGVETINGVKTFGSIPILPTAAPSSNNQAVRKGYVDTQVATKSAVAWTQIQATGTKIATITIDGTSVDVYAPTGGGSSAAWGQITGTLSNQTDLQVALDAKQPTIADLDTIRSGAALGTTSIQPGDNISQLTNDEGFITEEYHDATKADVSALTDHTGNTVVHVTSGDKSNWNSKQAAIADLDTIRSGAALGATAVQPATLSAHTSNNVIHVTQGNKDTWNGKYSKPENGIPSTDMTSAVQVSLGKADTALQEVPDTYRTAAAQDVIDAGKQDKDCIVTFTRSGYSYTYDKTYTEVITAITSGLNVWGYIPYVQRVVRPVSFYSGTPGNGYVIFDSTQASSSDFTTYRCYVYETGQATGLTALAIEITPNKTKSTDVWDSTSDVKYPSLKAVDGHCAPISHSNDTTIHVTSTDKSTWNGKQDAIADLDTIRSGSAAGATSIQPGDNVSELTNDAGFITDSYHDSTKADVTALTDHTGNVGVHVTPDQKATWNGKSTVAWTQVQTTGTKIATVNINGTSTDVYAPEGGSTVAWGGITGNLVDQADLYEELENRATVSDLDDHISDNSAHIQAGERSTWNGKQSAIADLDTIRSGAALGATSLQSSSDLTSTMKSTINAIFEFDSETGELNIVTLS